MPAINNFISMKVWVNATKKKIHERYKNGKLMSHIHIEDPKEPNGLHEFCEVAWNKVSMQKFIY